MAHRNFVKFTFLKVDPGWRRLPASRAGEHKREFLAACENSLPTASCAPSRLVGTRGDADLMLWSASPGLADSTSSTSCSHRAG